MPVCTICDLDVPPGSRTCFMCGTSLDDVAPVAPAKPAPPPQRTPAPAAPALTTGGRYCPVCVRRYSAEYADDFCSCGTELVKELPAAALMEELPMAAMLSDLPTATILDDAPAEARPVKPPAGTPCVVLYGPDKQPLQYFALTKDTTLIGRLDSVAGNFPDIDLDEWFDRATTRKISRQHALILRSRATKTFALRPLVGNTGTQIEGAMAAPQQDYPLKPGSRIILGGVIRLKFEIAKD